MAERPFLLFADATLVDRANLSGGGSRVVVPTPQRQAERLDDRFNSIVASFQNLQPTVDGIEPERVVVFEAIVNEVRDFARAAANIPGLEWVGELDLSEFEGDDEFRSEKEGEMLSRRIYAVFATQQGMDGILAEWRRWQGDPSARARVGFGPLKAVFQHLRDVRPWGPKDRLEATGILEAWREEQEFNRTFGSVNEPSRFEVELWWRANEAARLAAYEHLENMIAQTGGQCVAQCAIAQIGYHGVLVEVPAGVVGELIDSIRRESYAELLRHEAVMFFRPRGQAVVPGRSDASVEGGLARSPLRCVGEPIIAVLDGLPLENHMLLQGGLRIDDPHGLGASYTPGTQRHGTAMSSLILRGDLSSDEPPLSRPLHVGAIMQPRLGLNGEYAKETSPEDRLLVDLFYVAIRRLVVGSETEGPTAPNIRIVNLSLGNAWQPFDGHFSPLAKLLDWLSWEYRLLFIVSAGNHGDPIALPVSEAEYAALPEERKTRLMIAALRSSQATRRLLSPAESINAVTVGAWHEDGSQPARSRRIDLMPSGPGPSPIGTVASGFQQGVKPEVYLPGGRQFYNPPLVTSPGAALEFKVSDSGLPPGLRVAAPSLQPGVRNETSYMRGTSCATALATRAAGLAYEKLLEYARAEGWQADLDRHLHLILKGLLVHGAEWTEAADLIERAIPPNDLLGRNGKPQWHLLQRIHNRFIGMGRVDALRCQSATDQRATVISWGDIGDDEGRMHTFPLPPSLGSRKLWRRLTTTLAWMTPINVRHQDYRRASLWTSIEGDDVLRLKKAGLDTTSARRGTVEHLVRESETTSVIADNAELKVLVSCRETKAKLQDRIPYALVVSLEVAEGLDIPIYEQVKDRIAIRARAQAT